MNPAHAWLLFALYAIMPLQMEPGRPAQKTRLEAHAASVQAAANLSPLRSQAYKDQVRLTPISKNHILSSLK